MFNLSVAEPEDFEVEHYAECLAPSSVYEDCTCLDIERRDRKAFAANVADWKNEAARCY